VKIKIIIWAVAILFATAVAASAETSYLTTTENSWELQLVSNTVGSPGAYVYTYTLTNNTPSDEIVDFSLYSPNLASGITNVVTPTGWTESGAGGIMLWQSLNPATIYVAPSGSAVFGFTSTHASAADNVFAQATNSVGYNGTTSGPAVPEPGTILAALSILGPAGFVFRRKRV